jgi:uncharacterized protein (DUF952 family)
MSRVYKIVEASAWEAAVQAGAFVGAEIDVRDGYIHLSTGAQAAQTARLHFAGRDGLLLVALEAQALGDALKWEPSRGGDLFPHLYGPLDPALAIETRSLPLNPEGWPDPGPLATI